MQLNARQLDNVIRYAQTHNMPVSAALEILALADPTDCAPPPAAAEDDLVRQEHHQLLADWDRGGFRYQEQIAMHNG